MKTDSIQRWGALVAFLLAISAAPAAAKTLQIVTTTEDLAAIAREVAGDRAQVTALARGYQDPHFVDAKPSYMVQLRKADLFVEVGRDLEVGWAPGLLNGARNAKILPAAPGHVDASSQVRVIEIPSSVSRAQGDVHPLGNPHYWLDPANGVPIARAIRDGLTRVDPQGGSVYAQRVKAFETRLGAAIERWKQQAKPLAGLKIVTYHRSWSYFARAFGLEVLDYVEPKPGIPPSPGHVQQLVTRMKQEHVPLILMEPYFDERLAQRVAKDTGAVVAILPSSVGAEPEIKSYFDLFDRQLALLQQALGRTKS